MFNQQPSSYNKAIPSNGTTGNQSTGPSNTSSSTYMTSNSQYGVFKNDSYHATDTQPNRSIPYPTETKPITQVYQSSMNSGAKEFTNYSIGESKPDIYSQNFSNYPQPQSFPSSQVS